MAQTCSKLPEYLKRTEYLTKPDPDGFETPFQFALKTKESFFEYLNSHPDRRQTFNKAMGAAPFISTDAIVGYLEVGHNPPISEGGVLVVDVGGGCGWVMKALRAKFPELKGRLVVQDLEETIAGIKDTTGIEPMVHDFFTPQPVKGK